jgi:hypothetical protein
MADITLAIQVDDAIRLFLMHGSEEEIDMYFDELTLLLPFEKEKALLMWFLDLIEDEDSKAEVVIYKRLAEIQKVINC